MWGGNLCSPREVAHEGAHIDKAKTRARYPTASCRSSLNNPAKFHPQLNTAIEILEDTGAQLDAFVAGVGTGGTITGVGEVLKERLRNVMLVAVEPKESPVLSGGPPGAHAIQGIGAGFVPRVLNTEIIDRIVPVAYAGSKRPRAGFREKRGLVGSRRRNRAGGAPIAKELARQAGVAVLRLEAYLTGVFAVDEK